MKCTATDCVVMPQTTKVNSNCHIGGERNESRQASAFNGGTSTEIAGAPASRRGPPSGCAPLSEGWSRTTSQTSGTARLRIRTAMTIQAVCQSVSIRR